MAITDGLGRTTSVAYKAAKDNVVYTDGASVLYPIRSLWGSNPVVSDVWQDAGVTGQSAQFSYQYSGNRIDLYGRGGLGFHSFITLDRQTDLFKYQFLAQSFPMTGLTHREETYRWLGGNAFNIISSHDNTVVFDKVMKDATDPDSAYGTLWPFISTAVESRWEDGAGNFTTTTGANISSNAENLFLQTKPAGAHINITAQSYFDGQSSPTLTLPAALGTAGYNPSDTTTGGSNSVTGTMSFGTFSTLPGAITFGNLTQLSTDYGNGYTETVTTTYKDGQVLNDVKTLTGLVDTINTTVVTPSYTDSAPAKSYGYFGATPLVLTETVSGGGTLDTTTTYNRDTLGRVTSTSISGADLQSAGQGIVSYTTSQNTTFDARWDLPTTTLDNYGHTTTTTYHAFLGKPISVKGVNYVAGANGVPDETTFGYDALGRPILVTDALKNLTTTNTFDWDSPSTQSVAGPTDFNGASFGKPTDGFDIVGVTLISAYKVTTATTVKPTVTTYYDRMGRAIRTVKNGFDGQQIYTDTAYNNLGQVIATSLPYPSDGAPLWTKTAYDQLGRVASVTAPNGTITANAYAGRTTTVTVTPLVGTVQANATLVDAKGRTVSVWNADNQPTFTDNLGSTTTAPSISFALDGFGRMRGTTLKGQTQTITANYDSLGRQTQLADPDKGTWNYTNSALGQVLTQNDAAGNTTDSVFDRLGRPLSRTTHGTAPTETANFYYYDTADNAALHTVAKGNQGWIGAPEREECTATGSYPTTNLHYYDTLGRPYLELAQTDGKWFYTYSDYDAYSRIRQTRHYWKPSGHEVPTDKPYLWQDFGYIYSYDSNSYLLSLTDSLGRSWWDTPTYDYMDRVTSVRKGSGLTTTRTYHDKDGVLTAMNNGVQNWSFGFDGLGNLTSRNDGTNSETLTYDNLNRLVTSKQGTMDYADNGNITNKPDVSGTSSVSSYTYDSVHPHAVASAFGYAIAYDANGNMLTRQQSGDQSAATWTGFDKPRTMWRVKGGVTSGSEFHYNAARSRVMQFEFDSVNGTFPTQTPLHYNRKRIYALGSTLELNYTNSITSGSGQNWALDTVRIYVPGPDGIIGAREFRPAELVGGVPSPREKALVYHYDHLGSITAITDFGTSSLSADTGGKPGRYSEDAWGQRRNPFTWNGAPLTTSTNKSDDGSFDSLTPRGYTGHEMLDDLGLVHMNGRIYDPLLGRFLSADILVQAPNNLQAYNRYSYVLNNPLSFTDPSGFETIAQLEEKRKKESAEKQAAQKAAYAKGGFWGGVKNLFSKANIEHGAKIIEYTNRIAAIHDHADALSRINHASVDARKLDDVSAQYAVQELGLSYLKVIPFASVGGKMVTGDFGDAAKDAAVQSVFLWAGSKVAGLQGQGSQEIEAEISSRITTAAAEGAAAVGTRQAIARQAYIAAGYSEEEIATHLAGIDFSKPVETAVIPKGTKVAQWQPHTGQGSYYTTLETPGNTLGVDPAGRSQYVYTTTREVTVLRSTAADTSNMENLPARARGPGGGTQFFSNEKSAFQKE